MFSAFEFGQWGLIEPVMTVEVTAPVEFQGAIMAGLQKRHAIITGTDQSEGYFSIFTEVLQACTILVKCCSSVGFKYCNQAMYSKLFS